MHPWTLRFDESDLEAAFHMQQVAAIFETRGELGTGQQVLLRLLVVVAFPACGVLLHASWLDLPGRHGLASLAASVLTCFTLSLLAGVCICSIPRAFYAGRLSPLAARLMRLDVYIDIELLIIVAHGAVCTSLLLVPHAPPSWPMVASLISDKIVRCC
jgi:hypothetical protein